jgi:TonB family protein
MPLPFTVIDKAQLAGPAHAQERHAPVRDEGRFAVALATALCAHLLVVWLAAGGFSGLLLALRPPAPIEARNRPVGDPRGLIDAVHVEVVDAAEFDKRFVSFSAGHDAADREPSPVAAKSLPPPTAAPPVTQPVTTDEMLPGSQAAPVPAKPQSRKAEPAPSLTEAEIEALVADAMLDLKGAAMSVSKAGGARLGEASPFVRSVVRTLKETMPKPLGLKGIVRVHFIVSPSGDAEDLRLVQSSGSSDLDRLVLERIHATHFMAPPKDTPIGDRMFPVSYEYN